MADTIKIAYLYEDLMNTYGDSGDVKILRYLLNQQGYQVQVDNISLGDDFNADDYDFIFFGGGQDYEQTVVARIYCAMPKPWAATSKMVNRCWLSVAATSYSVTITRLVKERSLKGSAFCRCILFSNRTVV